MANGYKGEFKIDMQILALKVLARVVFGVLVCMSTLLLVLANLCIFFVFDGLWFQVPASIVAFCWWSNWVFNEAKNIKSFL